MTEPAGGLHAYLARQLPQALGRPVALQRTDVLGPWVWSVTLEDGQRLVAKHQRFGLLSRGTAHDLLTVEARVLGLLHRADCPVPRLLGCDPAAQFVFLEHVGGRTLDDLAQEDPAAARACIASLVDAQRRIDAVLAQHAQELVPHCAPGARPADLARAWREAGERATRGLAVAAPCAASGAGEARAALEELLGLLGSMPPELGSTDYNARNTVVAADGGVSLIEFAKIGWDWSARRLVQYGSSLGSGRAQGRFVGLLGPAAAARYAALGGDAQALDGHHLVFWLNAAALLREAMERPGQAQHRGLLAAWGDPAPRLRQARHEVRRGLCPEGPAQRVRERLDARGSARIPGGDEDG